MSHTKNHLIKLSSQMKKAGYKEEAEELETLDEELETERPLYEAEPTEIPGTWEKPSGELIKTSRD